MESKIYWLRAINLTALLALQAHSSGQAPGGPQAPPVVSPDVLADRRVVLRIRAPRAESVRLNAGDVPGIGGGTALTKNDTGVWEITVGPVDPGAYRYTFAVDGVPTIDPRSPATSESNNNTWSLFVVPGNEWMDAKNVPHGAVAAVTYFSSALSKFRRMRVYTPPGYEGGKGRYPVFYLLHGAGDSDDSWTSVGRANFILDNLIAAGKARPMIVVMPAGHTRSASFGGPPPSGPRPPADEFEQDFLHDIVPLVEKSYRVMADRKSRAVAGLSMGGGQTLSLAIPHPDMFGYVGVFSSGLFNAFPIRRPGTATAAPTPPAGPSWEEQHQSDLDSSLKKGLRLVWFSTGKDDFLVQTTRSTVNLLKKHGFSVVYEESAGGHTWLNWRDYLIKFAPQLFR